MTKVTLAHLTDLAIGTPEVGAVNFNALHTLLHAMLSRMKISHVDVNFDDNDRDFLTPVHPTSLKSLKLSPSLPDSETGFQSRTDNTEPDDLESQNLELDAVLDGGSSIQLGMQSPYHKLEEKVRNLDKKMEELDRLPPAKEIMKLTAQDSLRDKTDELEHLLPIKQVWQSIKINKRISANEDGIEKLNDYIGEMMTMFSNVQQNIKDIKDKIGLDFNSLDDLMEKMKNLETDAADLSDRINKSQCDLSGVITWEALESGLKGDKKEIVRHKADEVARRSTVPSMGGKSASQQSAESSGTALSTHSKKSRRKREKRLKVKTKRDIPASESEAESSKEVRAESLKGVPAESLKGVPAESLKGVPAESLKGVPAESLKGVPAESSRGVPAESSRGIRAESSRGVRAESSKGVRAESSKGVREVEDEGAGTESGDVRNVDGDGGESARSSGKQDGCERDADGALPVKRWAKDRHSLERADDRQSLKEADDKLKMVIDEEDDSEEYSDDSDAVSPSMSAISTPSDHVIETLTSLGKVQEYLDKMRKRIDVLENEAYKRGDSSSIVARIEAMMKDISLLKEQQNKMLAAFGDDPGVLFKLLNEVRDAVETVQGDSLLMRNNLDSHVNSCNNDLDSLRRSLSEPPVKIVHAPPPVHAAPPPVHIAPAPIAADPHDHEKYQEIQDDISGLAKMIEGLQREGHELNKKFHMVNKTTTSLQETKADTDYVGGLIDTKADKLDLDGKVNNNVFLTTVTKINDTISDLLEKLGIQEQDWRETIERLNKEMNGKLERSELGSLKSWLESRLKSLNTKIQKANYIDDEAAGIRKQLMQKFNCISCDRPIEITPSGPVASIPFQGGLPPSKSPRPYTTFELDHIRQHAKNMLQTSEVSDPYSTERACGGGYTVTYPTKRVTRTAISNLFREDGTCIVKPLYKDELDIMGTDGRVYHGRYGKDIKLPNVSPTISPNYQRPKSAPDDQSSEAPLLHSPHPPTPAAQRSPVAPNINVYAPPDVTVPISQDIA